MGVCALVPWFSLSGCFSCRVWFRVVLGLWTCAVLKAVSQRRRRYPWSVCDAVSPVYVLVSHVADYRTGTLGHFVVFCAFLLFDECRRVCRGLRLTPRLLFPLFAPWCLFNLSVVTLHRVVSSSTAGCPRGPCSPVLFLTRLCLCELSLVTTFITLASSVVGSRGVSCRFQARFVFMRQGNVVVCASLMYCSTSAWFFDAENRSTAHAFAARTHKLFDVNTFSVGAKRLRLREVFRQPGFSGEQGV